ncbi:MAG: ACP S-malonyltransferase, partial [Candidatus Eremiobacteraeota bacterium]|nr:ACP S-malonyltransferase [Candidatus Eremiobacteraeota bacterium]
QPAVPLFAPAVERAHISVPSFIVVSNVDAQPYRDVAHIKENLVRSVTDEVLWHATSLRLLSDGKPDLVIEFGASSVLASMLKRLPNAPEVMSVADFSGVQRLHAKLGAAATT